MHVAVAGAGRLNKYRKILNEISSASDVTFAHKCCIAWQCDFIKIFSIFVPTASTGNWYIRTE